MNDITITKYKWFHVSKFRADTDPNLLINHIASKTKIPLNQIKCFKLIKMNANISELKFVNFKISVPSHMLMIAMDKQIWPNTVQIKKFVSLKKNEEPPNQIATT